MVALLVICMTIGETSPAAGRRTEDGRRVRRWEGWAGGTIRAGGGGGGGGAGGAASGRIDSPEVDCCHAGPSGDSGTLVSSATQTRSRSHHRISFYSLVSSWHRPVTLPYGRKEKPSGLN